MWPEGAKNTAIAASLLFLLFAVCLLAYEGSLLRGDVDALSGKLTAEASKLKSLEGQYRQLNGSYNTLLQNYTRLSGEAERLTSEYVELSIAYARLNATYVQLLANYAILQQQASDYPALQAVYEALLGEHQALQANYSALKNEYESVSFALYEPLWSNETATPTISELEEWLAEDKTDELPYAKWDFTCGDYAAMLSIHAKMRRWDMGIVAVLGRDSNGNEFDHAFNAIRCSEGLVYVEPQNDQVFYGPIGEGTWYTHPGFGQVYVEELVIVVPFQPPF